MGVKLILVRATTPVIHLELVRSTCTIVHHELLRASRPIVYLESIRSHAATLVDVSSLRIKLLLPWPASQMDELWLLQILFL